MSAGTIVTTTLHAIVRVNGREAATLTDVSYSYDGGKKEWNLQAKITKKSDVLLDSEYDKELRIDRGNRRQTDEEVKLKKPDERIWWVYKGGFIVEIHDTIFIARGTGRPKVVVL